MTFREALDKLYMGMVVYWQVSRELAEIVGKEKMSIYEYTGDGDLDSFATYLRRRGYTAYVETDNGRVLLVTNSYPHLGINFQYIGLTTLAR